MMRVDILLKVEQISWLVGSILIGREKETEAAAEDRDKQAAWKAGRQEDEGGK